MFSIDDKDVKQLEADLKTFNARALPFATRNTLNSVAFTAMVKYRKEADKDLILRNAWTKKSIRYEKTGTLNINKQESVVGSMAPYMETQEFGGTKQARGKHGVALPTSYSTGEGEKARPRRKLPPKRNRLLPRALSPLRLAKSKRKAVNPKQALVFKVQDAVTSGNRVFYHNGAIFRVLKGRKKFKRGWPTRAELKMLYNLENRSVRIPPEKMLQPAYKSAAAGIPAEYKKSLEYQLRRLGLFKD